ncbi:YfdX family protein [Pseudomonas sp. AS2.8]|uniref:YfdX family protein n=1 Tax=Pseudomonas sp. AS2.8 TaxID=2587128 RepID=UPI00161FCD89|nr:YfdX family protein [Pseudomonas sp. AS2.8]MBB2895783.1 cellobiose-specific phosphotransferase system component IIA [Pseudomonas sp. AS2.8]
MNLNRRITKSLLVLTIASVFSTAALANTRPDIATQQVATLPAISQQGQQAFMDVVAARQDLFEAHVDQAKQQLAAAESALQTAQTDKTAYLKSARDLRGQDGKLMQVSAQDAKATAWLPIGSGMALRDDYVATPAKNQAVVQANEKIQQGDTKGAGEILKVAGVDVDYSTAVLPAQETLDLVHRANQELGHEQYWQANLTLKQVQNSLRYDNANVDVTPTSWFSKTTSIFTPVDKT